MTSTTLYTPSDQTDHDIRLKRIIRLATVMDSQFEIPGLPITVGWDSIIGLIPGVGDTITSLISAHIIREGHRLGVPKSVIWLMAGNVMIDWLIGSIPLLGDILDIGWKANKRNIALILKHARFV